MSAPRRPERPPRDMPDHEERERLAQAMAALAGVFDDIGRTLASLAGERCPYRTARDACTFHGGCRNQRRAPATEHIACGGDHLLCWTPVVPARSPEPV